MEVERGHFQDGAIAAPGGGCGREEAEHIPLNFARLHKVLLHTGSGSGTIHAFLPFLVPTGTKPTMTHTRVRLTVLSASEVGIQVIGTMA